MQHIIKLKELSKTYQLGKVKIPALKNVNLTIEPGEFTTLSGPSGSGKSTLLNLIGLIDVPTAGEIALDGKAIKFNGLSNLHELRLQKIGFIFQMFNLIPVLNAFENIEYPLLLTSMTNQERTRRVEMLLNQVGLLEYRSHKPHEMSGGQRQRVAIARALANQPKIILADEPTANIDSHTAQEILKLMVTLNNKENVTFIFATHDPQVVEKAKRVIKIKDGEIVN